MTATKVIVDCSTGFISEVPLSDDELKQMEIDAAAAAERKAVEEAEAAAKAAAKAELLAKLGITEDEAKDRKSTRLNSSHT